MAIDTAEKRKSIAGIPTGWGVTSNATPDAEWRAEVGWAYSGISYGAAVSDSPIAKLCISDRPATTLVTTDRAATNLTITDRTYGC
jgi:hypothetical protein